MFQTLQPQTFRVNKTGVPRKSRRINTALNFSQRPATMDVNRELHFNERLHIEQHLDVDKNYSLKTAKQNIFKTIDDAEIQLTNSFRGQMSPYIQEKIRNSLSRNHQRRLFFTRASFYQDNPEEQSYYNSKIQTLNMQKNPFSVNFKNFKFSNILNQEIKSPLKSKELIFDSIITNTKQKIDRMIGLKKQKQQKYQQLKKSIQKKCLKLNGNPFRKISVLNPTGSAKPPTIETLEWDKEWKQGVKKESNRYRNRLFAKHKRQMSMKIQLPDSIPQSQTQ